MSTQAPQVDAVDIITATPEALALHIDIPWFTPLWPSQRELLTLLRESDRVLFLKARQLRFTWTLALWALHRLIDRPAIAGAYVSIGQRESEDVTRRIIRLHSASPPEVRARYPLVAESLSRLAIGHGEGESELMSLPSSSTAGRGKTFDFVLGDERPKWPHPEEQEASLLPAVATGKAVLGGTANGFDSFRDRWYDAEGEGWRTIFAGALSDPTRTLEWVMREREILGELGPQEYPLTPEEAFLATGRTAFDRDALAWYAAHSCETEGWRGTIRRDAAGVTADASAKGPWRVWSWPVKGRDYLIVADTSGGHGEDYSAASVIDLASWDEVACYHAKVEPAVLAEQLRHAGYLWRGPSHPALLVPEVNNHGQAVVALLREWSYPRLYRTEQLDREGKRTLVTYGWNTTEASRRIAISALQRGLREQTLGIRDHASIDEMHRFVWVVINEATGTGRYQAGDGANDDRVLCWAIAAAVLAHAQSVVAMPESAPLLDYEPRVSTVTGY